MSVLLNKLKYKEINKFIRTLKLFVRVSNGSLRSSSEALTVARHLEEKYGKVTSIQFARNNDTDALLNHGWIEFDSDKEKVEKTYIEVPIPKNGPRDAINTSLNDIRQSFLKSTVSDPQTILQVKVEQGTEKEYNNKKDSNFSLINRYESMLRFNGFKGGLDSVKRDLETKLQSNGIDTNELQRKYLKELETRQTEQEQSQENQTNVSNEDYQTLATQSASFTPATARLHLSRHRQVVPEPEVVHSSPSEPKIQPTPRNELIEENAKSAAEEKAFRAGVEAHKRLLALKEQEEISRLEAIKKEKESSDKKKSIWNLFN
ncbi:hypothetical protein E3Q22_03709 [Wallemia mellicola]|uniref:Uncharacterized protein n=1 Tax=Wallemia mellicola TaxID=1708541 RepID=A0A4T0M0Q4_9BASI|nr:hypothetical protein E3Q22_03709 [Wallemia mellicola]